MQPIFPGESSVDQLVEIIKVRKTELFFFVTSNMQVFLLYASLNLCMLYFLTLGFGDANERGNQVHESKL